MMDAKAILETLVGRPTRQAKRHRDVYHRVGHGGTETEGQVRRPHGAYVEISERGKVASTEVFISHDQRSATEELRQLVKVGVPANALDRLAAQAGVSLAEIQAVIGIPPATAARKRAANEALSAAYSDRMVRVAHIVSLATEVLESRDKATHWMREPNRALSGESPLKMLDTEIGARQVERVLERIEHGVYS